MSCHIPFCTLNQLCSQFGGTNTDSFRWSSFAIWTIIKACELARSIWSLCVMWESPSSFKGNFEVDFFFQVSPNKLLRRCRPRLCQTKSMNHQGLKVRDHDLCCMPPCSRAHVHVSGDTVCDIKKGRDWVIQSGPWRKGYFFSFPMPVLGVFYWLSMLGHLWEAPEPLRNVSWH